MKVLKWIGIIIVSLIVLGMVGFQVMKWNTKKASPERTALYESGDTQLKVWYSSPSKKDRDIFGGLVPYEKVWRTGANEATEFTSNVDFVFGGQELDAGTYTLWTIPYEGEWQVILNSKMYDWGVDWDLNALREAEFDVANVNVPVEPLDKVVEQFTIDFEGNVKLTMAWDKSKVSVPISIMN